MTIYQENVTWNNNIYQHKYEDTSRRMTGFFKLFSVQDQTVFSLFGSALGFWGALGFATARAGGVRIRLLGGRRGARTQTQRTKDSSTGVDAAAYSFRRSNLLDGRGRGETLTLRT